MRFLFLLSSFGTGPSSLRERVGASRLTATRLFWEHSVSQRKLCVTLCSLCETLCSKKGKREALKKTTRARSEKNHEAEETLYYPPIPRK